MNRILFSLFTLTFIGLTIILAAGKANGQIKDIPAPLEPWKGWVLWGNEHLDVPSSFNDWEDRILFWPSTLELKANLSGAEWSLALVSFADTWVPLPGRSDLWPQKVMLNGDPTVVVERDQRPAIKIPKGEHRLTGEFRWKIMPQSISVPPQVGMLSLEVDGNPIEFPKWGANGAVWLKRRSEPQEENLLTAQVFRVVEDGIPLWLRTNIELKVSGKSREEDLGWLLPTGWQLANVESQLPVAIDNRGRAKAQVRAGKWTVALHAFRTDDVREFTYPDGFQPIAEIELVGFKSDPAFRVAELTGMRPIDVTQTTWPKNWAGMPVFQWETNSSFGLDQKMRGMGDRRIEGLNIERTVWLDEFDETATFLDKVSGHGQRRWRMDVAEGQDLGAVRINGKSQLVTQNPVTGDRGVEVRDRNLRLTAISRGLGSGELSATGWNVDADSLNVTWNLPPGWRMLALFGADSVRGDWLTAWSLLDLFLLLIFSLAVFRIWGLGAGLIAFLAFGLAYHEPSSPRYTWLFMLLPAALLSAVPEGKIRGAIQIWKYVALLLLLSHLTPFVAFQIQTALFPQLERAGAFYGDRNQSLFDSLPTDEVTANAPVNQTMNFAMEAESTVMNGKSDHYVQNSIVPKQDSRFRGANMLQTAKARIQTGPAQPSWSWNQVHCYWDGPVSTSQTMTPIFLTRDQHRVLNVVRIGLLIALAYVLSGFSWGKKLKHRNSVAAVVAVCLFAFPNVLSAQDFPNPDMLDQLRARLLESEDKIPKAAEIPSIKLKIDGNAVTMVAQVHAADEVAVPLPGRLPGWSPVAVNVDGQPAKFVCRRKNYLWIALEQGVHEVEVKSLLPEVSEWEWTYLLKPRSVDIEADSWTVTGVGADGVPEEQVFFARQLTENSGAAAYDQKNFNAIVAVDRHLETGLVWQVRSTATRISSIGKAVSIKVPLLPGESVLSSDVKVEDGFVLIRMSADQMSVSWTSDLPIGKDINLTAAETDQWVERWHLLTSPVWNVTIDGLSPIFEAHAEHLVPVWLPWPGESVSLSFSQPEAVVGETITVQKVSHATELGSRQRTTRLELLLECSLGGDFPIDLPEKAEVESVEIGGHEVPVRVTDKQLVVPVDPGTQMLKVSWRTDDPMQTTVRPSIIALPYDAANISTSVYVPSSRWVLWTQGPTRGPAVQFWVILVFSVLVAWLLGGVSWSPLRRIEWVLLVIGLTQVPLVFASIVVGWLFLLGWRSQHDFTQTNTGVFNAMQIAIIVLTLISLAILIIVVSEGLLGRPEMFIRGNGSTNTNLNWFQPQPTDQLPQPLVVSTSVWVYRVFMLLWALWLASALLRWLSDGWQAFAKGGLWRSARSKSDEIINATDVSPAPVE